MTIDSLIGFLAKHSVLDCNLKFLTGECVTADECGGWCSRCVLHMQMFYHHTWCVLTVCVAPVRRVHICVCTWVPGFTCGCVVVRSVCAVCACVHLYLHSCMRVCVYVSVCVS